MFESQYNDEMEAEVKRLEALARAAANRHERQGSCAVCGCELLTVDSSCQLCPKK